MESVKIGLLHSLTGALSISEKPLLDAELLAIEEINAAGGVLGAQIDPQVYDCRSSAEIFALAARSAIDSRVSSLFGGLTSASRKEIRPIVEENSQLLWYPLQHEGLEESPAIVYTGSCANQQLLPALQWCQKALGRSVYLLGSDYVFPRTANRLMTSYINVYFPGGAVCRESYLAVGATDFSCVVDDIRMSGADVVISTVVGASVPAFFSALAAAGLTMPVLALCAVEYDFAPAKEAAVGHYACRSYFQSVDSAANRAFVEKIRRHSGMDAHCSAPMVNAYNQLYLWKAAVEKAGRFDPLAVADAAAGLSWDGPAGEVTIRANHYTTQRAYIGRWQDKGGFAIEEVSEILEPLPWLGIERVDFPGRPIVIDALFSYPEAIHLNNALQREIHCRKESEEQLRLLTETLEERVQQRTLDLAASNARLQSEIFERSKLEKALDEARRQAEKADLVKSQFLSIISHELRTPMTGILGMLELAQGEKLPEPVQSYLGMAHTSAMALQKVLEKILDYVSLSQDGVRARNEPFILADTLAAAVSPLLVLMQEKGLHFNANIAAAVPPVINGDESRLILILFNLLENAVKFTEAGEIRVAVDVDSPGRRLVFTIGDSGVGIAHDKLPTIFNLFEQVDMTDTRAYNGIGLGLAMVKRLGAILGGEITVESRVGEGSVFKLALPLADDHPDSK